MKMQKAVLALLLTCVFALSACGNAAADSSSSAASSNAPVSAAESSEPVSEEPSAESSDEENSEEPSEISDEASSEESDVSEETSEESEESGEETSEYVYEDVNFAVYQKINKDIYAWIRIPGTPIDYPILNRKGDNEYYLKRNYYRYADTRGSIFTEDYNNRDFNDPVTLIYGHNMSSGSMFGSIQKTYTKKSFMQSHKELQIILPDKTYTYEIFAAVPYSNIHLMYYYDFTNTYVFTEVMNDILSVRAMNAVVDKTVKVNPDDHIVILSTCLSGNGNQRYLLLAVRRDAE
jgi:hypothetical protein